METIFRLVDRKGDKGQFRANAADDASARIVTFLTGKSYAGGDEYSTVTTGVVLSPKTVVQTDVTENDIDFSCILRFKNREDPEAIKVLTVNIPAPIINEENGICAVYSDDRLYVPAIPPSGAVGLGGNSLATAVETMLGITAGDLKFVSGAFEKTRR